ncbi:hypothetical protein B7755_018485 [Streptomyces sp. NBS 14/10]|uniref:hypothetical protein n=1 Tax=Streptomyces sp. NBS 14/10 TaxID=1945643 RepID=UPI000B801B45|nr:hypothetical protein [Streptomyces sp. NBS 14/10]KAK1179957.1 hypothetical protein B7755_018485 [Streptomyces sp. NBS 14/10]
MSDSRVSRLAGLRKAAGYTQASFVAAFAREAARLCIRASMSVRQLRRWESESPPPLPHPGQQAVLEAMFGLPLAEMGFEVPSHRYSTVEKIGDDGEVKRRAFVTGSGAIAAATVLPEQHGSRVGASEVAALRARLHDLYTVDHQSGGIPASAHAGQLGQEIAQVLSRGIYTSRVGRDLQAMLSELHSNQAWYGYDSGPIDQARTAAMEALTAAQLIGDGLLQLSALETLVLMDIKADRLWEAASAVEFAYGVANRSGAGPTVHFVIALREANVATHTGNTVAARRALSRALSYQSRTDMDADVPQWARFAGPIEIDYATADMYVRAGEPRRAVPFLRAAVDGLAGGYARNTAWYRSKLACTLLDAGEVEEACAEMGGVLDVYGEIKSDRLTQRMDAFCVTATAIDTAVMRDMSARIREAIQGDCS